LSGVTNRSTRGSEETRNFTASPNFVSSRPVHIGRTADRLLRIIDLIDF